MKALLFDVLGTVVDLSDATKDELKAYARHLRQDMWSPLQLPSRWESFPAHPDSKEGLERLRKKFTVVTCSNPSLGFLMRLSKHNQLNWDAIVPLELGKVFKPNSRAYRHVAETIGIEPADCMMVTANLTFGDLEGSAVVGMTPMFLDRKHENLSEVNDILGLANFLGC